MVNIPTTGENMHDYQNKGIIDYNVIFLIDSI